MSKSSWGSSTSSNNKLSTKNLQLFLFIINKHI